MHLRTTHMTKGVIITIDRRMLLSHIIIDTRLSHTFPRFLTSLVLSQPLTLRLYTRYDP